MASLSSNSWFGPAVGVAATLAAASTAPAQVTQQVVRDTRPLNPTGNSFLGRPQETYVNPNTPLNGRFSVMRQTFPAQHSGATATLSFDTVVIFRGAAVPSTFFTAAGNPNRNDPLTTVINIWRADQFNPADLASGLVSTQIVPRVATIPTRVGSDFDFTPVFQMSYNFTLPEFSAPTDYLIAFARASSSGRFNFFEVQRANPRAGVLANAAPDYTLNSELSVQPVVYTPLETILVNPLDPTSISFLPYASSNLVVTTIPEPSAIGLLACAAFTGLSRVRRK